MGNQDSAGPEKTLVLYEPKPSGRIGVVTMWVLFFASLGLLSDLYGLPESRFPYRAAGYVEIADMEVVGNAIKTVPSGEYEFIRGGSSAWLYQRLIPTLLLAWFAFHIGHGSVVAQGSDLCFFFCLGCICLICYCAGWIVQGGTVLHKVARYVLFGIAGIGFLLSLSGVALFRYAKYSYYEPEAIIAMACRMSKFGGQS